jgi:hypothetical protein
VPANCLVNKASRSFRQGFYLSAGRMARELLEHAGACRDIATHLVRAAVNQNESHF